jgi:L,D-transpeptidase ErfK/SrfK
MAPLIACWFSCAEKAFAEIRPLVGTYTRLKVKRGDTLLRIARREDVNVQLLASLNHLRSGSVRPGTTLTLPTLYILPRKPAEGIVLNIPERRIYLFRRGQTKAVYPVAVGAKDWQTVTGVYKLASKVTNPKWKPTKEMVEREDIKDDPVPPGKDNPVGDLWMGWSKKGYGFHSTIAPDSIGKAVTHGCIRLYPESAHKMYNFVREGETIYSIYEPIVVGRRENKYYLSVFPDIYHKNLVSTARAKAILQKEGLLSRVNMNEVAQIVRKQVGYPLPLHLKAQVANKPKGKTPPKAGAQPKSATKKAKASPAKARHQVSVRPHPGSGRKQAGQASTTATVKRPSQPPNELESARSQGALLLARYKTGHVKLINRDRDLPQIEQLARQGYVEGADHKQTSIAKTLRQALARLANRTSAGKPLVLMSLVRPARSAQSREPHSRGLAADIAAFGGHTIDNRHPAEAVAGVISVLQSLPPGQYRLGLPKPPDSDPEAFLPPPTRPGNWPFFPAPVPAVGKIGLVTFVVPKMNGDRPVLDSHGQFVPDILHWANERSIPLTNIGEPKLRAAIAQCSRQGIDILLAFPDAADHLHIDVAPLPSAGA